MQTFEVVGQTNQHPLARRRGQAAQRELTKAKDFFDDADNWLNRTLTQALDRLTARRAQLVSHLLNG